MLPDLSQHFTRFRYRLKGLHRDIGRSLGWNENRFSEARGARIVLYHGICRHDPLRFNTLFITRQTLEAHLRLYKKYFNIVSLDDFYRQRFTDNRFTVCLTFDDGFANNYHYVLPLLQQYEAPATFFITGIREAGYDILWNDFLSIATRYGPLQFRYDNKGYIKNHGRYISVTTGKALADELRLFDFAAKEQLMQSLSLQAGFKNNPGDKAYWEQMNGQQIRELAASPWVTIGSHGYYHNDLSKIPLSRAKEEMTRSKQWLEQVTGQAITALAFPYGAYTAAVKEEAKNAGYTQLLATEFLSPEDTQDKTLKERLTINPFISPINQLHATINGHYE